MKDLFNIIVLKYNGSMKGEHGTGRNVSPFVEKEWGKSCYKIMEEIKKLFDPQTLINHEVIFNKDEKSYLKNTLPIEKVDPIVDDCVECGFCEPVCPSRDIALNPRDRIAVLRELRNTSTSFSKKELKNLELDFNKRGINTCGSVGVCSLACPIGIDTGEMVKKIHTQRKSKVISYFAEVIAKNFSCVELILRNSLKLFHFCGENYRL